MFRLWSVFSFLQTKSFRLIEDVRCSPVVIDDCDCHSIAKAPVRCPCSRLAALHGAPRTLAHRLSLIIVIVRVSFHQYVFFGLSMCQLRL